jgi:peptide/nickel transport system permease protein
VRTSAVYRILRDRNISIGLAAVAFSLAVSLVGIALTPFDPLSIRGPALRPPSDRNLLGTDDLGRDVLAMLSRGTLVSLFIGVVAALVTSAVGILLGIVAGVYGGYVDFAVMRAVEFLLSMPSLVLALILVALLRPSVWNIILVLAVTGWPGITRVVRGYVLQVMSSGYIEAAKALGADAKYIVLRHLVPVSFPVALASIVSSIRSAVLLEAGLSFLGLGDPSTVSLGTVLFYARRAAALASGAWWTFIPAGLMIATIVFGLTMISIGIERYSSAR